MGEPASGDRWLTYLTILLRGMAREDVSTALSRLSLNKDEQHEVLGALDAEARLAEGPAIEALGPAERYHRLAGHSLARLQYLAVVAPGTPTRRALVDYWTRLRPVKLRVDGKDLRAAGLPPGPLYGEILKALMDARLTGSIETLEEERNLLAELAAQARKETETPC
jgi:tRNA nucleotidyltransferase (CCA-adding enzyme)